MLQASLAEGQHEREGLHDEVQMMVELHEAFQAVHRKQESTIDQLESDCQEVRTACLFQL